MTGDAHGWFAMELAEEALAQDEQAQRTADCSYCDGSGYVPINDEMGRYDEKCPVCGPDEGEA